jgi:hypothetical protein
VEIEARLKKEAAMILYKPVNISSLVEVIQRVLSEAAEIKELRQRMMADPTL